MKAYILLYTFALFLLQIQNQMPHMKIGIRRMEISNKEEYIYDNYKY